MAIVGVAVTTIQRHPAPLPQTHMAVAALPRPVKPVDERPIARPAAIEISRAADGLFYVDGEVNGTPVRFLVDTGATTVVLAPADAARAGIDVVRTGRRASISTSAGKAGMYWASAGRIKVASHEFRNADVAIPDGGLQISLLGQSALSQMGPLTFDGDSFTIVPKSD